MSMDKERSSVGGEQQPDEQKVSLDILELMIQLGIHPDKWRQYDETYKK
ncbi:hypothetical protein MKX64_14970 [Paenibacillus sp. FSL M8-0334]